VFTRAHPPLTMSLSWVRLIQPMHLYPMYERSILICSSHLCQSLASSLCHSAFLTKTLYAFLFPPPPIWTTYLIHPYSVTVIRSVNCDAPVPSWTNNQFSNALSIWLSLNVRDQIVHRNKNNRKFIVLYIWIFMFLVSTNWEEAFPKFSMFIISSCMTFGLIVSFPNTVFNLCQIFKRFISHHYVVIFDTRSVDEMNRV
jgi:hypothetical protein